jgi:UDP-N-acetylmuramoylalanine--D-glutamate ligase
MDWKNKRVIIMGAARQGTSLARYLVEAGAQVVLTDTRSSELLSDVRRSLADLSIEWILGEHPTNLLDKADLVCPSGGVPLTIPFIQEAIKRSIPLSNDSQIFIEAAKAKVIGITGSAGKTTTTTLVGLMAERACKLSPNWGKSFVGGNIGNPLLNEIKEIDENDLVVMELSSFQLEIMTAAPQIAAVLNITPNHLDRHKTMEAYTNAKLNILKHQDKNGIAVLQREDIDNFNIANKQTPHLVSFESSELEKDQIGSFVRDRQIWLRDPNNEYPVLPISDISLKGQHNILNVLAAVAISSATELPIGAMQAGVIGFTGVEHRLELVRDWGGAAWYNDSIATAPERTIAAIHSFDEPIILLLGGRDKDLPWQALSKITAESVSKIVVFGEASQIIKENLEKFAGNKNIYTGQNLEDAVRLAAENVEAGDVVLLSPGGTSFDEFVDFAERGQKFKELVNKL